MDLYLNNIPAEITQAKQRFGIIGNSQPLIQAIGRAVQVAPIDLSVLIIGQSGTGKEFFPKIIHANSYRKHGKYIAVNCGAIPEGTIDSELFGHEKGAFTGAVASRKGYFEEADGGTIFLDEVGELPLTTQARLLRVLETGEFIKVGSSTVQKANVRIVAATNVDIPKAVAQGRFREDLYYRLSTVTIQIPRLSERGNDITLLARKFAADFAERYTIPPITFDETARHLLTSYAWPGNVRQLKNIIEQIALFCSGTEIDASTLRTYLPATGMELSHVGHTQTSPDYAAERELLFGMILRLQKQIEELTAKLASHPDPDPTVRIHDPHPTTSLIKPRDFTYPVEDIEQPDYYTEVETFTPATSPSTLEETERETIRHSLERNGGRRKATAAELNISERTLYRKIKEYGIE